MRSLAQIFFLFVTAMLASAAGTNYFCVVCGKGPLTGHVWISKWGPICDDCYKLENHCSICGLPIRDGFVKTADGRFICKFDKTNAVLDVATAREVFTDTRRELVELLGPSFALNYPEVTVNLFDVDYWSENGRSDGLHKFGFASTRKTPKGACTHEVVMLSGRLGIEIAMTSAHEYTHLWINENRPAEHVIDADTTEAICELVAFKLMESWVMPDPQQKILNNPYTHGEIKKLVALEKDRGIGYILNWVKTGTPANFEAASRIASSPSPPPVTVTKNLPMLPDSLKLNGLLVSGQSRRAIICGETFETGDTKPVKLQNGVVQIHCREIHDTNVVLDVVGKPGTVTLNIGEEKRVP
jgi:hypothetical protein